MCHPWCSMWMDENPLSLTSKPYLGVSPSSVFVHAFQVFIQLSGGTATFIIAVRLTETAHFIYDPILHSRTAVRLPIMSFRFEKYCVTTARRTVASSRKACSPAICMRHKTNLTYTSTAVRGICGHLALGGRLDTWVGSRS